MLYHYTTFKKLKNILETKQFWLTKISDFKDVTEFFYAISMVCDELSLPSVDSTILFDQIAKINDLIFVGCFCSDVDSFYLWKNYGEFNIEFSKKELMNLVYSQQRTMGYIFSHSNFLPCEYHRGRQETLCQRCLEAVEEKK